MIVCYAVSEYLFSVLFNVIYEYCKRISDIIVEPSSTVLNQANFKDLKMSNKRYKRLRD